MAIVAAQTKIGVSQASTISVSTSFASTPGTGSLIIAVCHVRHSSTIPPDISFSDNQGNTYTIVVNDTNDETGRTRTVQAFVNLPTSSGTFTVTATATSTAGNLTLHLYEVTGQATSGVDEAFNGQSGLGISVSTLAAAPAGNAFYTAAVTCQTISQTVTEESEGWTLDSESEGGSNVRSLLSKVSSGSISGDWTLSTGGNWTANIVAWKEAAAGATDAVDNPNEWYNKNDAIENVEEQFDNVDIPFSEMGDLDTPTLPEFQYIVDVEDSLDEQFDNYDTSAWSWENPAVVVDSDVLYQYDSFVEELEEQFDNVESSGWSWENPAAVPSAGDFPDEFSSYYEFEAERLDYAYDNNFESELYTQLPAQPDSYSNVYVRQPVIEQGILFGIGKYLSQVNAGVASFLPTINRIYFGPIQVSEDVIITELGVLVTAVDLDGQARLGLYFNNLGKPGQLIYQNIINLNSIGYVSCPSQVHVAAGTYWTAFITNMNSGTIRGNFTPPTNPITLQNSSDLLTIVALYQDQVFGSLPNEASIGGQLSEISDVPHVRLKIK